MQRIRVLFVPIIVAMASVAAIYQFNSSSPHGKSVTPVNSANASVTNAVTTSRFGPGRSCPGLTFSTSLKGEEGFQMVRKLHSGSSTVIGFYDFVLPPGSTGRLDLTYRVADPAHDGTTVGLLRSLYGPRNASAFDMFNWPFFTKHVWKFDTIPYTFLPAQAVGINVDASTITPTSSYSVDVTYTISASSSAARDTYLILLPQMCLGQLITIGDTLYEGPLPQ